VHVATLDYDDGGVEVVERGGGAEGGDWERGVGPDGHGQHGWGLWRERGGQKKETVERMVDSERGVVRPLKTVTQR